MMDRRSQSDRTSKSVVHLEERCDFDNEWALRDSNPRPAECKWERFSREGSSMVAFVDIH
jgi:hypothetical protein